MADKPKLQSGVDELIAKLRDDGVNAGKDEAQRLVSDAQTKATSIVTNAKSESEDMVKDARERIEKEKNAANASLKTAVRDTELMLESELKAGFADHVKRLVSAELKDPDFLKQMILTVAGRMCPALPEEEGFEVLMPAAMLVKDEKGDHMSPKSKKRLHDFVLGISGDMLRDGVEFKAANDPRMGLRLKLNDKDLEIDLTDNAISNVLLQYLLPRYRAIVSGEE